jgi:iron(III) transport system ATP-binding protein
MPPVEVTHLSMHYGHRGGPIDWVLRDIHITAEEGEFLVLLGPSGSGKTTLLRCLAGMSRPVSGVISLGGKVVVDTDRKVFVPPNKRRIGMVFQNYALWPHMTVWDNVAYPLRAQGRRGEAKKGKVDAALRLVRCERFAKRLPAMLSGGQQQRVALARAMVCDPSVMLMDEPLSNLDALLRLELRNQIREVHRRTGFTCVYVTHDQSEAMSLGSRIALMNEGVIEQVGDPEEVYRRPSTKYSAEFLGMSNILAFDGRDGRWAADGVTFEDKGFLPKGAASGQLQVMCRPAQSFVFGAQSATARLDTGAAHLDILGARVVDRFFVGEVWEYMVSFGQATWRVRARSESELPEVGSEATVRILHESAASFADDGTDGEGVSDADEAAAVADEDDTAGRPSQPPLTTTR